MAALARDVLEADGIRTRLVSLPCFEAFERQVDDYRESILPRAISKRVTVEAGVTLGWDRYAGPDGAMIGIDHFGASAPGATVLEHFGFTAEHVAEIGRRVVREGLRGRIPSPDPGHQPAGLGLGQPIGRD